MDVAKILLNSGVGFSRALYNKCFTALDTAIRSNFIETCEVLLKGNPGPEILTPDINDIKVSFYNNYNPDTPVPTALQCAERFLDSVLNSKSDLSNNNEVHVCESFLFYYATSDILNPNNIDNFYDNFIKRQNDIIDMIKLYI